MSLIGPRPTLPAQVDAVHRAPARAPRGPARASPAGRRSTGAPRCRGRSGSSSTSTTSTTARWRSTCRSCGGPSALVLGGVGLYKGDSGGWQGRDVSPPAVLLTGAGKRYDIVSCFAALTTTVVADPAPLAPAQYAAHVRAAVPLIDDPAYVPALAEPVRAARRRRRAAAHRPRHRGARRWPARRGCCRRSCPLLGDRPRDLRQVRGPPAARAPRAALAADGAARGRPRRARIPGDGQAPPRLGGALDPPRPRRRPGALLRRLRAGADDGAARDGRARSSRSTASATSRAAA